MHVVNRIVSSLPHTAVAICADKLAEDDPDYRIAERFPNMDRDDVYNELVRIFPIVQQKIQRLGLYKLTPEGRFGTAMMSYAE